jgi:hypothetical protein
MDLVVAGGADHSVAVVALRTANLTVVRPDDQLVALRLLVDRRDELARSRTQTICRLHKLLLELVPGGAKRFLTAAKAKTILDAVKLAEADVAARVRHQIATEMLDETVTLDKKMKDNDKACARQSSPPALPCWQPAHQPGAARHGHRADPPRHRRARLLPPPHRRRRDQNGSVARAQTTTLRCGLPLACRQRQEGEPGRTRGDDYDIQRGRPSSDGRLFGPVTARARARA